MSSHAQIRPQGAETQLRKVGGGGMWPNTNTAIALSLRWRLI